VLALASADAPADVAQRKPAKRQPDKRSHGDARPHHAAPPSRSQSRVRHSSLVNGGFAPFEFGLAWQWPR
jgi:hypothetical protein